MLRKTSIPLLKIFVRGHRIVRIQLLNLLNNFFDRRWRSRQLGMPIPAVWTIRTKPQLVHIALLDILIGVLVNAILLPALSIKSKKPTYRHSRLVILVKETAGVAFHAKASKPVPTYSLPEAPSPRLDVRRARVAVVGGIGGCVCGVGGSCGCGAVIVGWNRWDGGDGVGGARIEAALEVEA